ncbi:MAG TPA: choice-of-anchor D domain-containing protein [Ignavibacteria bacterium]|nr:choice-of-anchor D domain-containing protein [Ignavibacteria bacterium]
MKQKFTYFFILLIMLSAGVSSQTLVSTYNFLGSTAYNGFWGITQINDTLRIGSSSNGKIYTISKTGVIRDSLTTPFNFNNGLAYDGTGFWIARNASGTTSRIIKVNSSGSPVDTIRITSLYGNSTIGIGGIAMDGPNHLWAAIYYPDFASYPFAYAYKFDIVTKNVVDSIPLRGKQVQGITVKGDTILYVTDNFQGDAERIYGYRKAAGDTIFSFAAPDPDGDCDPRGIFWDGSNLWLMAYRVGNNISQYRTLYKYLLNGQGSPTITTNLNSINFGNVPVGTTGNQPLIINNTGTGKLIISAFNFTNPRFSISPNIVPDTIQPGSSKNYTMGFSPLVYDTLSGVMNIISNDLANPTKSVNLFGKGVFTGPYIGISASTFNFTNKRVNSLTGFTFNITNQGSAPLTITGCNFSSARYRYDTTNANFPVTIDTQRTRTFRIWFNPNAPGSFSDSAIFQTNAVNNSSAKIVLTGAGIDVPPVLGDIVWESIIPDNPLTTADDPQPKSLKQIPDVNGDGVADMICATENYWTICYNGNSYGTADTLWKFNTCFGTNNTGSVDWEDAMQIMDDVNGDGIKDVVIGCGGGNEEVYVLSGSTGRVIWEYAGPNTNYDGDIMGIRVDRDFNGDGRKDVLISASGEGSTNPGRHSAICLNAVNGNVLWTNVINSEFTYDVVSTTVGGAIAFTNNSGPYGIIGLNSSGASTWNYPIPGTLNAVWSMREVADINADGNTDIVGMYGFNGTVVALSGSTGSQVWTVNMGSSNNGTVELLDDLNQDGFKDFTCSGPQTAFRIDSKTGQQMWTQSFGASYIRDAGILGDITGDTVAEVLYSTQAPGKVFVVNGKTGTILFNYEFGASLTYRADRVAALNSVDGNQWNEFVAVCRDGRVKCFNGGPGEVIGITNLNTNIPDKFALYQNYPNPFNPETNIKFELPHSANVKIAVYDMLGREVDILINGKMEAGVYNASWNATPYSSGVYFYRLTTDEFVSVKKMILIK